MAERNTEDVMIILYMNQSALSYRQQDSAGSAASFEI